MSKLYVVKRGDFCFVFAILSVKIHIDGRKEQVMFDKITSRISKLCYGLDNDFVEPVSLQMHNCKEC